jgi:hypothetical protein
MRDLYLWECQGERFFLGDGPQQVTCNRNKNLIFGPKAQYMIQKQQRLLHCDAGNNRIMLPNTNKLSDSNLHFNPGIPLRGQVELLL